MAAAAASDGRGLKTAVMRRVTAARTRAMTRTLFTCLRCIEHVVASQDPAALPERKSCGLRIHCIPSILRIACKRVEEPSALTVESVLLSRLLPVIVLPTSAGRNVHPEARQMHCLCALYNLSVSVGCRISANA